MSAPAGWTGIVCPYFFCYGCRKGFREYQQTALDMKGKGNGTQQKLPLELSRR
jgi:hypothetical protein